MRRPLRHARRAQRATAHRIARSVGLDRAGRRRFRGERFRQLLERAAIGWRRVVRARKFGLRLAQLIRSVLAPLQRDQRGNQVETRAWNRDVVGGQHAKPDRQRFAQMLLPSRCVAELGFAVAQVPQRVRGVLVLVAERLAAQFQSLMESGKGAGPVKPLDGSPVVNDKDAMAQLHVVLEGRLNGAMPAWKGKLSETEIAAAVTYTKNAWSNHTGQIVQPADVLAAESK